MLSRAADLSLKLHQEVRMPGLTQEMEPNIVGVGRFSRDCNM
jgi:hypothetical protein